MLEYDYATVDALHPPTSANFHFVGATQDDLNAFYAAMAYLSQSPHAQQALQDAVNDPKLTIVIVHNGEDKFTPWDDKVYWDPKSAYHPLGNDPIRSFGILHEFGHHDAPPGQIKATDAQYGDTEERRVITGLETLVAIDLGEPTRGTHDAAGIIDEDDPTFHDDTQNPPPIDGDLPGLDLGDRAGDEEDDDPAEFGSYWGGWTETFHGFNYDYSQVSTA